MRVLVCGDRDWTDSEYIYGVLKSFNSRNPISCVIEGEARGADRIGRASAERLGIPVEKYPANWDKYGKSAGAIRNRDMLIKGKPDLVIAFHDWLETSKGTKDMVGYARKQGVQAIVLYHGIDTSQLSLEDENASIDGHQKTTERDTHQ